MISLIKKIFILMAVLLTGSAFSQKTESPYEVGTWPNFRPAAVCFTFDDGCPNQYVVALPMFDKYGFKLTMFTVTNWSPRWDTLALESAKGHEIASHTVTHPFLDSLTIAKQTEELQNSQEAINAHVKDARCVTIAYPYCIPSDKEVCGKFYIAARGCSGQIESSTPKDFMNISSILCGSLGHLKTVQDFQKITDSTATLNGLVVFLLHGIDNDGGYSPITTANLQGTLDYMKSNQNKFWVSTFGNIVKYIKERDNISFKELSSNKSKITFTATHNLDNSIYNFPVTVRRKLPAGWNSAKVKQNSKSLNLQYVYGRNVKYVMFDVVPNGSEIVLSK